MEEIEAYLTKKIAARKAKNYLRTLPKTDFLHSESNLLDFSSNDYLGLARNEQLRAKIDKESKRFQALSGATGSRLISGNTEYCEDLEAYIANFHHTEAALIFNSGYNANVGLCSCIASPEDTIFYDELSHASIRDGLRLSRAKTVPFQHNDLGDLAAKIEATEGNIFIVVESVYSMDGDIAPLEKLVELTKGNARVGLIVDEAHGFGVFGENGAGLVQALGLENHVFARVMTYGKAAGGHGSAVVGSAVLKSYLINYASSFIYTTALPIHALIGIKMSYELMIENDFQKQIFHKIDLFLNTLKPNSKQHFVESCSPIQSLIMEGNTKIKSVANQLNQAGFGVKAILFPTVPKGQERIRISLHVFNEDAEILRLTQLINRLI
jgi:8-amino-7-oxononanoate synthase